MGVVIVMIAVSLPLVTLFVSGRIATALPSGGSGASTLGPTSIIASSGNPYLLPTPTHAPISLGTPEPTIMPTLIPTPPWPVFCTNEATPTPGCAQCPYSLGAETETQAQIIADLKQAGADYHIPYRLLLSQTRDESGWREKIISCSNDVGLGQIKWNYWWDLNALAQPTCGIAATNYAIFSYSGNAHLAAKLMAWIACFYSYAGSQGGTLAAPAPGTAAYFYAQAGRSYPDSLSAGSTVPSTSLLTVTPSSTATPPTSLCASVFKTRRWYSDLPSTLANPWSCPFSATSGDHTLLDITISAYNEGIADLDANGIHNQNYVTNIEQGISNLANSKI